MHRKLFNLWFCRLKRINYTQVLSSSWQKINYSLSSNISDKNNNNILNIKVYINLEILHDQKSMEVVARTPARVCVSEINR